MHAAAISFSQLQASRAQGSSSPGISSLKAVGNRSDSSICAWQKSHRRGSERKRRCRRQRSYSGNGGGAADRGRSQPQGPADTPLRADNRALLMGLLTERAAKTLQFYFMELNPTLMQWLEYYLKSHPIPREGSWEDVSGDTFLRKLLSMPLEETRWDFYGRDKMFSRSTPLGVDPRQIAQRIMEIRAQIAREWIEELRQVSEENAILMRETVTSAFVLSGLPAFDGSQGNILAHPELVQANEDD